MTLLCGASILGIPWALGITILLAMRPGFLRSIPRSGLQALIVFAPILILLGLYLAWTVRENIQTGFLSMSVPSMLAVFYEQLGFLGLGPGRNALRQNSVSSIPRYLFPLLLLGIPLFWGLVVAGRRRFGIRPAHLTSIILLIGSPVFLIFALSYLRHARILARHLTPLFPFILITQAYIVVIFWKSGRRLNRVAAILIIIALTLSSFETRFAFRHSKDDNRDAVAVAKEYLAQERLCGGPPTGQPRGTITFVSQTAIAPASLTG